MQSKLKCLPSWRGREHVSLSEAAILAGYGYYWAYERASDGRLDRHQPTPSDPIRVTVASLILLIDRPPRRAPTAALKRPRRNKAAYPRLAYSKT